MRRTAIAELLPLFAGCGPGEGGRTETPHGEPGGRLRN